MFTQIAPVPTRRRPLRAASVAVCAVAVAALTACSTGTEPPRADAEVGGPTMLDAPPVQMEPTPGPECLSEGVAHAVVGESDPRTAVAWAGGGTKGVLLAPQAEGDVCQWADELVRLAADGYLAATYDWGTDGEAGFHAALDVLEATGAQQVAFVGASAGGTLAAGLADDLGAVAVVALSPPATYGDVDARAEANQFTGPLQVFSSTDDPQVPASESGQVPRQDKTSVVTEVSGTLHGIEFLGADSYHADHVRNVIDESLTQGFAGTAG